MAGNINLQNKTVLLFGRCNGFGGNTFGAFLTKI
jgi:hypothetical protein